MIEKTQAAFQNVSCFVSEQSIMFHNAVNNAVKKQLDIGFIVDSLFGNFAYLHK